MSFLGMGTFEIIIILLVAFIFLGPERMVDAARTLGRWTGELRRMGSTVQAEMDDIGNIGAPLSQRPAPPQQSNDGDSPSNTPLDQDEPDARQADAPVAFRSARAGAAQQQQPQPPREETRATSGEDSA